MCIYFGVELIMFVFVLISFGTKQQYRNVMFAVVCILWTIVYGFRGMDVGNDTINYVYFFQNKNGFYGTLDKPTDGIEPGFLLLMRIVLSIINNPTVIYTLQSSFMFYVIYKLYTRVNPRYAIWSLLFFFVVNWSYITLLSVAFRQAISVSLLLYGLYLFEVQKEKYANTRLKWYQKKQLVASFLVLLFAATVHKSTLVFIPIILFTFYFKLNRLVASVALLVTFVISVFFSQLISQLYDFAMLQFGSSDSEMISMLENYSGSAKDANSTLLGSLARTIIYLIIVFATNKNRVGSVYFNNLVLAGCLFNILSFSLQAGRVLFVFTLFSGCMYIPLTVGKNKLLKAAFIVFTLLYMYRSYSAFNNWEQVNIGDTTLPYKFIWE